MVHVVGGLDKGLVYKPKAMVGLGSDGQLSVVGLRCPWMRMKVGCVSRQDGEEL